MIVVPVDIIKKYGLNKNTEETWYGINIDLANFDSPNDFLVELESRILDRAAEIAEKVPETVHGSRLEDTGDIIAEQIRALKEKEKTP